MKKLGEHARSWTKAYGLSLIKARNVLMKLGNLMWANTHSACCSGCDQLF